MADVLLVFGHNDCQEWIYSAISMDVKDEVILRARRSSETTLFGEQLLDLQGWVFSKSEL